MNMPSGAPSPFKPFTALLLAAAAIFLALLVIWATRPEDEPRTGALLPTPTPGKTQPLRSAGNEAPLPGGGRGQPMQTAVEVSWEENLDAILSSEGDNRETVRRLLQGFDRLPLEAQTEYIAHALNLSEDDNYKEMEVIYLRSDTPAEVRELIFDDSLNRPDEIKLPMMARTMSAVNHPLAEEAREILVLYLDLDPDVSGPVDWSERVRSYLKENAVEE